jgi:glycosyltransferase involved in cell wall biosynthesis
VASPLGANPHVIEHGRTGFLASSHADWQAALKRLVEDVDLRARMGRAAAEAAHARYTLSANAEKIVSAFQSALSP